MRLLARPQMCVTKRPHLYLATYESGQGAAYIPVYNRHLPRGIDNAIPRRLLRRKGQITITDPLVESKVLSFETILRAAPPTLGNPFQRPLQTIFGGQIQQNSKVRLQGVSRKILQSLNKDPV